jgi:hypothetical protein
LGSRELVEKRKKEARRESKGEEEMRGTKKRKEGEGREKERSTKRKPLFWSLPSLSPIWQCLVAKRPTLLGRYHRGGLPFGAALLWPWPPEEK